MKKGPLERTIAYAMAGILLLVGVVCYAAFAKTPPEYPIRIMMKNAGGKVLFTHKEHYSDTGYGFACDDCHHELDDLSQPVTPCIECHLEDGDDPIKRSDALHSQCIGCHEEADGPVACAACHAL